MRKAILVAVLGATLVQLQGCLPLVATGAGAGVMMATDRRSSGIYIEDQEIELRAANRAREAFPADNVHVNFTSYNQAVLITGEVPDETTKQKINSIVMGISNVKMTTNELRIAPASLLSSRSNDAYITTKVKTRFFDAKRFSATAVKIVTENGVVYLMGLVTQQEGIDAAQIASTTSGVTKVVKLFDYIAKAPNA
ncbi:MAG: BON domain-containing protein [Sulfuriferula sp.]|nr:BON domain-containing protein [Sulfuriferula sp.]